MHLAVLSLERGIAVNDKITEKILNLVQSPLLQGAAVKTLLQYFNTLVKIEPNKYKETVRALTQTRIYGYVFPITRRVTKIIISQWTSRTF